MAASGLCGLTAMWFSASPVMGLLVMALYWFAAARYWRMGSQFLTNACVAVTLLNFAFGWMLARTPAYIGLGRYLKNDWNRAAAILDRAVADQPDNAWLRLARLRFAWQADLRDIAEQELAWWRGRARKEIVTEIIEIEHVVTTGTGTNPLGRIDAVLEQEPHAVWLRALGARYRLANGDVDGAEKDARAVISAYGPLAHGWLLAPVGFAELRFHMAWSEMTLSHVARLRGDDDNAREHAQKAWDAFCSASMVCESEAAGARYLSPQRVATGNLCYAWMLALHDRAEDKKLMAKVNARAKQSLRKSLYDLEPFARRHVQNRSVPTVADEYAALRLAREQGTTNR